MSKIVRLEAQNIKRLRAVQIAPDKDAGIVVIRGDNAQGKTSVLDAIAMALGGKSLQPPKVIRNGEESAQIVLETEELIIKRRFTAGGQTLEVLSKEGASFKSPQAKLDALVGRLSFDPLSFMRLEPRAQAEAVRKLVGLDFTEQDKARAEVYAQRTEANKLLASLKSQHTALADVTETAPVDVRALVEAVQKIQVEEEKQAEIRLKPKTLLYRLDEADRSIRQTKAQIEDLEKRLSALRAHLDEQQATRATIRRDADDAEAAVGALPDLKPEKDRLNTEILSAEATNERARKWQAKLELAERVKKGEAHTAGLTTKIEEIDAAKAKVLSEAKFPVPGMGFADDGVTLNGLPLEQASGAEQLRLSLAMGIAMNPTLRVMLIRDGSLLDGKSLAIVEEMAKAADAQVWIEVVGKDGTGIVIEDGAVAGVPLPELEAPKPRKSKKAAEAEGSTES